MSSAAVQSPEPKKYDLLLVSSTPLFKERIEFLGKALNYSWHQVANSDEALASLENVPVNFVFLDASDVQNQNEVIGHLQGLRFAFPQAPISVAFPKRFDKATLQWIRKSGANYIMSESEVLSTSRLDYFVLQSIGPEYLPVKHGDFKLDSKIELPIFYFMSANRRYFPIVTANSLLDEGRMEKIKKMGDVYIRRGDLLAYSKYLQANQENSAKGLLRRCRLQFNEFRQAYLDLVNYLTENADASSYDEGKKKLDECEKLSGDLVSAMMSAGSVFDVISQATEGELNMTDRAPERAAIVGFLSVMSEVGNAGHAILAAMLADVGIVNLPPECFNAIRTNGVKSLSENLREQYHQHPQLSVNCAAQKKIQLDPIVRDAILHSHARLDEQGFPLIKRERISVEAQLVHFVQILDDACQVQLGKARTNYNEALTKLLNDSNTMGVLSVEAIKALKAVLS
jgi:hypothetical protein